ncbi:MAG: hypothetical protein JST86_07480 [Bacteroidetes bacterium]|nr:hypothetical protein [Bacteroidota bacterium]
MKWTNKIAVVTMIAIVMVAISSTVQAQRHRSERGYRYGNYYSYNYRPYRPAVSVRIGSPYGYYPYYNRPVYRAPYSYVHFGPSFGFRINVLPVGFYPFYVGPNPYYYYEGVYYRPYSSGGYEVVAPPLGAEVKHLPSGAKATVIDGVQYYELGGTFYQEQIDDKNKVTYKVVGTDGVLNTGADQNTTTQPAPPPASTQQTQNNTTTTTNTTNVLPEVGARFDKLPDGSKLAIIKKEKYYVSPAGVYYQEVIDGNNIRYEVTGTSADQQ